MSTIGTRNGYYDGTAGSSWVPLTSEDFKDAQTGSALPDGLIFRTITVQKVSAALAVPVRVVTYSRSDSASADGFAAGDGIAGFSQPVLGQTNCTAISHCAESSTAAIHIDVTFGI